MTDRDPKVSADQHPHPGKARSAFPPGGSNSNAHLELAPRGDGPPMSLTIAPRLQPRTHPSDGHSADPVRGWLARVLEAAETLPAFTPIILPANHPPSEAELLGLAAACPDLFLVHAPDHTAGERVIADLARLVTGGQTLVLSPNPAAADRIVERLARPGRSASPVAVIRALADDENPVRPSSVVSRLTSAAYPATQIEQGCREADVAIAAAAARLTAIERLGEIAEQAAGLDIQLADLAARRDAVEGEVRDEATGKSPTAFTTLMDKRQAEAEAATAEFVKERIALETRRRVDEGSLTETRRRLAESGPDAAKKSGFFGRLFSRVRHDPNPTELEKQLRELESEIAAIDAHLAELRTRAEALAAATVAERDQFIREEVTARRAQIEPNLATLKAERQRLRTESSVVEGNLGLSPTPEELSAMKHAATRALVEAREHAAEARHSDPDARRLLGQVSVIVGTPGSVYADRVFAREPSNTGTPPFELLVLDRAEELTESDFVQLARLARRWVLVGDVAPAEEAARPYLNGGPPRHAAGRNGRSAEPPFAARIARILDRQRWVAEGNWLVCRLAHPAPEQRPGMTREPLLDRPEIELRFVAGTANEPVLAEVAFPIAMPITEAKAFLFHHLGEVLLRPCGPISWHQNAETLTACWPAAEHGSDCGWIDLEPGVREKVVGSGLVAFTAAVSFDTSAGWDAEKAGEWLEGYLAASVGRVANLPRLPRSTQS